jgi:hypothetical protein
VASSLYELDGVTGLSGAQPLGGAVLRYTGDWKRRSEASVGFRWSWRDTSADRANDPAFPDQLQTTAQELMASAGSDVGPVHVSGGAAYELVLGTLMRARATATLPLGRVARLAPDSLFVQSTLSVEYRRHRPTFALDSIFNYFSLNGYDEYSGLVANQFGPRWRGEVRLFERRFHVSDTNGAGTAWAATPGGEGAHGARESAYGLVGRSMVDGTAQLQLGYGGTRVFVVGSTK